MFDVFLQLRFCAKEYEPFDTSDIMKYVITDDYTPLWEVSSRKEIIGEATGKFGGSKFEPFTCLRGHYCVDTLLLQ